MPEPTATLEELLKPLRNDPSRAAVLLDVDGVLAPIVAHPDDAHMPETTRRPLIDVAKRYGVVACVSGRRASDARRIVSLGSIAYLGSHGSEVLRPGSIKPEMDRELQAWTRRVQDFAHDAFGDDLRQLRVRLEDKEAIAALHWREVPDEEEAEAAIREVAAVAAGFAIIWALAWRRQDAAVAAIEDRDGFRFYLDKTPPLSPIRLVRTRGLAVG